MAESPQDTASYAHRRRSLDDLSVNVKILASVTVAVLVAVIVGLVGVRALSEAADSAHALYANNVASTNAIGQVDGVLSAAQTNVISQLVSKETAEKAENLEAFQRDQKVFRDSLATYRNSRPAGDPAVIAALESNWRTFVDTAESKLIPAGARNDAEGWESIRDAEVTPVMTKAHENADALLAAEDAAASAVAAATQSSYRINRMRSIVVLIVGAIVALGLGLLVARRIVSSLTRVKRVCDALAAGDLTHSSGLTSRDEPGKMGQALDTALQRLRITVSTIDASASSLTNAAQQMSNVATQITGSAQRTSSQAQTASTAAEQVSRSVETVSSGSEEMGASIREISENASEAARVASDAVTVTASTSSIMNKLGDSSTEIGNVVKVITSIAQQTNLLALNATIEAARAGDAGKGFAVVASEVKDLAQETARATQDISRRVEAIQNDTASAVNAIDEITDVIARISDFQTTIASAVEEQTATTSEMNRSVTQAAVGTADIARNILDVAEAARVTTEGANESQQGTAQLTRMSGVLTAAISGFRY